MRGRRLRLIEPSPLARRLIQAQEKESDAGSPGIQATLVKYHYVMEAILLRWVHLPDSAVRRLHSISVNPFRRLKCGLQIIFL